MTPARAAVLITALLVLGGIVWAPAGLSNAWLLLTGNGYELPPGASWRTFEVLAFTDGNGDHWTYGADPQRYYHAGPTPIALSRLDAARCDGFKPTDVSTWCIDR